MTKVPSMYASPSAMEVLSINLLTGIGSFKSTVKVGSPSPIKYSLSLNLTLNGLASKRFKKLTIAFSSNFSPRPFNIPGVPPFSYHVS